MSNKFRAVFFDRDETLAMRAPDFEAERDKAVGEILGKPDFKLGEESASDIFWKVFYASELPIDTDEKEDDFWRKYLGAVLTEYGFKEDAKSHAADLHNRFAYHRSIQPYPEVEEVLRKIKKAGFLVGIISDTFPSLEASFENMGLAHLVDSYTASMIVGCSKPEERIYYEAMKDLGVEPHESLFVDDLQTNVAAARGLGMTSFRIDRASKLNDLEIGVINRITTLLPYLGIEVDTEIDDDGTQHHGPF